jgi:hypothetical protein
MALTGVGFLIDRRSVVHLKAVESNVNGLGPVSALQQPIHIRPEPVVYQANVGQRGEPYPGKRASHVGIRKRDEFA